MVLNGAREKNIKVIHNMDWWGPYPAICVWSGPLASTVGYVNNERDDDAAAADAAAMSS